MLAFGQHLMVDGYGGSKAKLQDLELVYNFLESYPVEMQMTKIMPPYVFKYSGLRPEDWGISGVVLIAESHISIHTFPEKRFLSVDIFSCKQFDSGQAVAYLERIFLLEKTELNQLERGLEFPKNLRLASNIVYAERQNLSYQ